MNHKEHNHTVAVGFNWLHLILMQQLHQLQSLFHQLLVRQMNSAHSEWKCLAVLMLAPVVAHVCHPHQPVAVFALAAAVLGVAQLRPGTAALVAC